MSLRRLRSLSSLRSAANAAPKSSPFIYTHPESQSTGAQSSTVQVLSWGRGSSGQLGGGKEEIRFYPTLLTSLLLPRDFALAPAPGRLAGPTDGGATKVGVACGLFHSAMVVDGKVWIWGKGDGGRLGFGDESSVFEPALNPNLDAVRMLALGGVHSTALTRNGEVFTWGYGGFGALGHSVYHRELLPRLVNGPWEGTISHLATGGAHTAAITDSDHHYPTTIEYWRARGRQMLVTWYDRKGEALLKGRPGSEPLKKHKKCTDF